MLSPIKTLYTYFPWTFFLRITVLILVDVVVGIMLYKRYKKEKIEKSTAFLIELLVVYISFILFLAVLGRRSLDYYRFGAEVISYYSVLFTIPKEIDITELVMNIIVFVPIGGLVSVILKKRQLLWAALVGFALSCVIEFSQLVLRCGYVSGVDIIHNTLGALIGGCITIFVIWLLNNHKSKK